MIYKLRYPNTLKKQISLLILEKLFLCIVQPEFLDRLHL